MIYNVINLSTVELCVISKERLEKIQLHVKGGSRSNNISKRYGKERYQVQTIATLPGSPNVILYSDYYVFRQKVVFKWLRIMVRHNKRLDKIIFLPSKGY